MRRIVSWREISIMAVVFVTVAPTVIPHAFERIGAAVSVSWPRAINGAMSCKEHSGEKRCHGRLVFNQIDGPKDHFAFFGVSTTSPVVTCVEQGKDSRIIAPHHWISKVAVYASRNLECDGMLEATLVEYDRYPANAWSVPLLVVAGESRIASIIRAIEFYDSEFRPLLAIVALFQLTLTLLFFRIIGSALQGPPHMYSFFVVACMAVINGGLVEKLTALAPWEAIPYLKYFFSNLWFGVFAAEIILSKVTLKRFSGVFSCILFLTFLEISAGVSARSFYPPLIGAWGLLAIYSRFRFLPTILFILNAFYLLPVFSPLTILPVFSASFFLLIYVFGYQVELIKLMLRDWKLSLLASRVQSERGYRAYLKLVGRTYSIRTITLAIPKRDSFEYQRFTSLRQRPTQFPQSSESSVISKVYATNCPLLDLSVKSGLGMKISNKSKHYRSDRFSAVPVNVAGELIGVLCLTDYELGILHPDAREALVKTFASLGKYLGVAISNSESGQCAAIDSVIDELLSRELAGSIEKAAEGLLEALYTRFQISGYFGKIVENGLLSVLRGKGVFVGKESFLTKHEFTVNPENEFGPISLAFRDNSPIVLQNWKPISDKLSSEAKRIYVELGTNSIMTVPVIKKVGSFSLRYLLWLQTDSRSTFSQQFLPLGQQIQNRLEKLLDNQLSKLAVDTTLLLAESGAIHAAVSGESTKVEERGELMMVDLCRSTELSGRLGNEKYRELKGHYRNEVERILVQFDMKLQMIIGDALLFTRAESDLEEPTARLISECYRCDDVVKARVMGAVSDFYSGSEPALRFCVARGDISRDMVDGTGWAIVGSTISEVHKIESVAKSLRSGFYFELSKGEEVIGMIETHTSAWPGSPTVRYLAYEGSSLRRAS